MAAVVACVLGCLTLAAAGAQAATIAVDIEADTVAADGHCSLREAITTANDDAPPFIGAGECAAGAVSDLVTLPAGHFVLSRAGAPDDTNVNGDLDVLGAGLTIRGQGQANTTIDANRIDRVLDVLTGRVAALERLTVTGGQAPKGADGGPVTGAAGMIGQGSNGLPGEPGGGIRSAGTLTVTDATVTDNRAGDGGNGGSGHGGDGTTAATGTSAGAGVGGSAAFFSGGNGGGIFTSGALTLTRVTITGNRAGNGGKGGTGTGGQGGGGISGNGGNGGLGAGGDGGRGGSGGGIAAADGATLTIDLSAISGNTAGDGGAEGNGQGGLGGVTSGNAVGGNGGFGDGGANGGGRGGFGGGINAVDPIKVTRSAVTGNSAGSGGHGGNGTGGLGGHGVDTGAIGGNGGFGEADDGGDAGFGGGVNTPFSEYVNVTVQGNHVGVGGDGGTGKGGNGGVSTGGPTGGSGGGGTAGDGGTGGTAGGLDIPGSSLSPATITHATITGNGVGAGGAVGSAIGGNGGSPGGAAGGTSTGLAGSNGVIGGILGGSATTLANSVVAGNAGTFNCSSGTADGGHNFTFPGATCPGTVADPQLGALADNGGPTMTQALQPGSPLIDAVPAGDGCAGTDQRGIVRPQGPACDSGAYEVEVPTPPGPDTKPPAFLAASLRPARFAVNRRGARETPVAARAHRGTTFRFRLSEAARVVFTIQRAAPGRRVKGRCVKPRRSNRRRPKCTRFAGARRFAVTAVAGANAKKFSGKIGRRALRPGRYRATLVATDAAGNASAPKRLKFRVVRR